MDKNSYLFSYKIPHPMFLTALSSHRRCSVKKGALRNFRKFTGKHLCQSLFFNKVAGLRRSIEHLCTIASAASEMHL